MSDWEWLAVGGSTVDGVDPGAMNRLIANSRLVSALLDRGVDVVRWRAESGLRGIYLVLHQQAGLDEPGIEPLRRDRSGVRTFVVRYDWLTDRFLDRRTGPWEVLGVVCLVLAEIARGPGVSLPRPVPELPGWLQEPGGTGAS